MSFMIKNLASPEARGEATGVSFASSIHAVRFILARVRKPRDKSLVS